VTTVVSFVIVIGILILIHELGHFIVARLTGVGVERFSIGFGPVLFRWRGTETEYCLSAIPMGGYVKMLGEENPLEGGGTLAYDPKKAFALKPLWARFLIVFAGPAMNFVLAAVIAAVVLATVGRAVWPPAVGRVADNGPAAAAGLRSGDVITAIDSEKVSSPGDIIRGLSKKETGDVSLTVVRDRNTRTVTVTPEKNPQPNIIRPGTMGTRRIVIPSVEIPAIPEMNIRIPRIAVPATPPIDVTVPTRAPRTTRSRTVII